jgi:pyruvate dehydrogenase E2 component (dihydrolipoamide acetyltransferase)
MPTVVKMPKWGLTMTSGKVTEWLRAEGSEVGEGDALLVVETEKAVNDVEAPADGILRKIVAVVGDEVPVSGPIAVIVAADEQVSDEEIAALVAAGQPAGEASAGAGVGTAAGQGRREARAPARDERGRLNASPAARKLAQERGIDLATVEATGPGGRITSDDVERAATAALADPTPREGDVELSDGLTLHYLVAGPTTAANLVFLHGLGGSLATWQVALGELVEHCRVCAFDLPGHGASARPDAGGFDYGVAGLADAVAAAISAAKLAPAVVVGHSLGGAIAIRLALGWPDLVAGLILVNSAGLGREIAPELLDVYDDEPGPAAARALLDLFYEDKRLITDRGVAELAQGQLAAGAWPAQQAVAGANFSRAGQTIDLVERLGDVATPTLIVWGERDRVMPLEHALSAIRALPDAWLKVMPGLGHVPQVEDAAGFARAVARFARAVT